MSPSPVSPALAPVIGVAVSPAFGRGGGETMSGLSPREVVVSLVQGAVLTGCDVRMVRVNSSVDVVRIAWEAARAVPSGIGIGVLAKGTAVLHSLARSPRDVIELSPPAPMMDRTAYRSLGTRAARMAKGLPVTVPDPVLIDPGLAADLVERVREYGAVERHWCHADPPVEDLLRLD